MERAEEVRRAAEERAELDRMLENNEGITWEARLLGIRSDAAAQKGIRARTDDKITLPPSAWSALQRSGAAGIGGHMFFEVSTTTRTTGGGGGESVVRRTHASILGFDGVEGNVGLPEPILRQLAAPIVSVPSAALGEGGMPLISPTGHRLGTVSMDADESEPPGAGAVVAGLAGAAGAAGAAAEALVAFGGGGGGAIDVKVSFRRLPKGTYAKLQPRSQDFQGELALEADVDLRGLLEEAMLGRSTLTIGDVVGPGRYCSFALSLPSRRDGHLADARLAWGLADAARHVIRSGIYCSPRHPMRNICPARGRGEREVGRQRVPAAGGGGGAGRRRRRVAHGDGRGGGHRAEPGL